MKLEGSLDAFSLPDIFQLLSFTKKSGGLHLRHADTRGCVYFVDGAVTGATSDEARQGLARRLVVSSLVSDDHLCAAVARAEHEPGTGVAKALIDAGAVDAVSLRELAGEHTVDAVFDFLRWSDGDFSFSVGEQGPDDVGILVAVDELVAGARSRLEAFDAASRLAPSDAVLAVRPTIDDDAIVTQGEWALLALVDGHRSVTELVELGGRGDFAVVSALAALIERDLLGVQADGTEANSVPVRRFDVLSGLEAASPRADSFEHPAGAVVAVMPVSESHSSTGVSDDDQPAIKHDERVQDNAALTEPAAPEDVPVPVLGPAPTSPFARAKAPAAPQPVETDSIDGRTDQPDHERVLVPDTRAQVIPGRPEGFGPRRRPDFPDDAGYLSPRTSLSAALGGGGAQAAVAEPVAAEPALDEDHNGHIERDPSVNKSLLLRLIAGVRGL